MVWVGSGLTRLAPSLVALIDEADARWPNRSKASDGSIGDAAHSARVSDHNPGDDPADADQTRWVCAVDLTDDPVGPLAFEQLDAMRRRRDPRVKYGISEGHAFYSYEKPGRPAWTWVKYTGPNGHFHHGHISIHNTATARNDLSPWFSFSPAVQPAPTPAPTAPVVEEDEDMVIIWKNAEGGYFFNDTRGRVFFALSKVEESDFFVSKGAHLIWAEESTIANAAAACGAAY